MDEPKTNSGKRAGAERRLVLGASLALLVLPLLLVSFVGPLRSLSIPLHVEIVRSAEYVADADRQATAMFLDAPPPAEDCWREIPSGRLARVREGVVEQFVPGTSAPMLKVSDPAAVEAELAGAAARDCWYATSKLHMVQHHPATGDLVELTRLGPAVVSRGELGSGLRFGVGLFAAAGVLAAVLGRRRVTGEVALASLLAAVLQLLLWFGAVGFDAARFGGELRILGDGFEMTTPFGVFACGLAAVYVLSGLGGALVGSVAVDAVTRQQPCVACGHRFPASPLPEKCPACGAAVDRRGVQWQFVALALTVTLVLVGVLLLNLGEALSVFMRCLPRAMTQACRVAWHGGDNGWVGYGSVRGGPSGKGFAIVLHQTHYLVYTAVLMFAGPFLLAWRLHRGARPSALALVGANWVAASLLVATLIGSVGASGVFVIVFQTQMLAALAWGVAGVAGAMLGHALRQRSGATMFEEVDG